MLLLEINPTLVKTNHPSQSCIMHQPRICQPLWSGERYFTSLAAEHLWEGSLGLAPDATLPSCNSDQHRRVHWLDSGCWGCVHTAMRRVNCTMGWVATAQQKWKNRDFSPECTNPPRAVGEQLVPVLPYLCYMVSWSGLVKVGLGASCWTATTSPTAVQTVSVHTEEV